MALRFLAIQAVAAFGLTIVAWAIDSLPFRRGMRGVLLAGILCSPSIIPGADRQLRLAASILSVTMGVHVWDLEAGRRKRLANGGPAGFRKSFVGNLWHPFALVLARARCEPPRPALAEVIQILVGVAGGVVSVLLLIAEVRFDWRGHSMVVEHIAKAVSFFLGIQFLPNAIAAAARLGGFAATDFAGAYFLAATPAEFWRRYNRPVDQFMIEYVFRPSGGMRHPIRSVLLVFLISGVIHEYVFDVAAGRVLGTQMAFFMIQGLAVAATVRVRLRGWGRAGGVVMTFAFNLASVWLFLQSLDAVLPVYSRGNGE